MPTKKRINKTNPPKEGGKQKRKLKDSPYFHYALILLILALLFVPLYYLQSDITHFAILQNLYSRESSNVLTFTEAGNQTDYFKLPENANVTSSSFNLTGLDYSVASLFQTLTQSDFDEGTYNQTEYNATNNAVQLNLSYGSGNYTSKVLDTGWNSSYQNLSWHEQRIQCPEGMAYISKLNGFCIDKYEAVALNSDGSWHEESDNQEWRNTGTNSTATLLAAGGKAGSIPGKYPWVYIKQTEARTACENAGKHLCTDEEWLGAANIKGQVFNLSATISDCTVSRNCVIGDNLGPNGGDACYGGNMTDCVSSEGVYDMVGNVWEWTNETVDVTTPASSGWNYINTTDMTWSSSSSADDGTYGNDGIYFPSGSPSDKAVLRGGGWSNGAKAGPFCANLRNAPSNTSPGIGFRCCSS